ncbi:hypothetical protein C8Q80DRAFT_1111574 [Daedaleopsis nitida]|nr:hypothetical protein C8Q80DRAFT_1111574 [Daedaleopsis nitida]
MIKPLAGNMASIAIECTFSGIFFVLSSTSLVLLVQRRYSIQSSRLPQLHVASRKHGSQWKLWRSLGWSLARYPLFVANVLLVITITTHWIMAIHTLFIAEVDLGGGEAAVRFYNDLQNQWSLARNAVLFVDMLLGDSVMIYRTWIIWAKDYRIIVVPGITMSALVAFGIGLLYVGFTAGKDLFTAEVGRWIAGYCIATLCSKSRVICALMLSSAMIAYRIWANNRAMKKTGVVSDRGDLSNALVIFVESAALYSGWAVLYIVFYITRSPLQHIGANCGPAVIGIAFTLITVRVGLGWSHGTRPLSNGNTADGTIHFASPEARGVTSETGGTTSCSTTSTR